MTSLNLWWRCLSNAPFRFATPAIYSLCGTVLRVNISNESEFGTTCKLKSIYILKQIRLLTIHNISLLIRSHRESEEGNVSVLNRSRSETARVSFSKQQRFYSSSLP